MADEQLRKVQTTPVRCSEILTDLQTALCAIDDIRDFFLVNSQRAGDASDRLEVLRSKYHLSRETY